VAGFVFFQLDAVEAEDIGLSANERNQGQRDREPAQWRADSYIPACPRNAVFQRRSGGAWRRRKTGLNLAAAILKIPDERRSIGRFLLRAARKNSALLDGMTTERESGFGIGNWYSGAVMCGLATWQKITRRYCE